tara:strand:- start:1333 stop:2520 length:1188 start_codon:yes stop_codon:yes gene_type:complete
MAQVSVGNYPIPNSTGANVRADINENLTDLYSTSSGSTPPPAAGSATGQLWIDTSTTPDTLKVKTGSGTTASNYTTLGNIASNFGHATEASPTFTGNVGFPAGSSSSLPIRNAADTDTGIYFGATNELDILAGNTDVHTFTASASEPKLPLRGTNGSASAPALSFSSDTNLGLYRSAADILSVTTGGTERVSFDSSGVNIKGQLDLRLYDSDSSNYAAIQAPSNIGSNYTLTLPSDDGSSGQFLKTDGSGNLSWQTQATTSLVIKGAIAFDGSGNVIKNTNLTVSRTGTGLYTVTIDSSIRNGTSYGVIIGNIKESASRSVGEYTTGDGSSPWNYGLTDNLNVAFISSRSTNSFNITAYRFDSEVTWASSDDGDKGFTYKRVAADPSYISIAFFS